MGWSGQSGTARYFFGTIIENLLQHCPQTIMVMNLKNKMVRFGKIYVLIPRNADHEIGFQTWMNLLLLLRQNTSGELLLITDKNTRKGIHRMKETAILTEKNFRILSEFPDMKSMTGELRADDLLVVISARQNSVSYSRRVALAPRIVTRYFNHTSSMILYPEQPDAPIDNLGSAFGGI
jgi:hypothetical protein